MMTSDDTQLLGKNTQVENPQNEQTAPVAEETSEKQSATWKKVAIGGTSGILLGAGALYAVNAMAGETQADAADPATASPQAAGSAVATVEDDMTFAEAFQSARAQVGPGGVFEWHGGVYGTYTADEWKPCLPRTRPPSPRPPCPTSTPTVISPPPTRPSIRPTWRFTAR